MEVSSSDKRSIFDEGQSPDLFARFASAGRWLRFLGSVGFIATAICTLVGIFDGDRDLLLFSLLGGSLAAYICLQLISFGSKAIAAKRSGNLVELSGSGRHLTNAFRALGIGLIIALAVVVMFVCWLTLFGNFSR